MDSLVSTEWLAGELEAPDLKILDASFNVDMAIADGYRLGGASA